MTCAAHALKNALGLSQYDSSDPNSPNRCNDQKFQEDTFAAMEPTLQAELVAYNKRRDENIAQKRNVKNEFKRSGAFSSMGSRELDAVLGEVHAFAAIRDSVIVIDSSAVLKNPDTIGTTGDRPPFGQQVALFKNPENNKPLYFLVNTAHETASYSGYGHWLPIRCDKRGNDVHFTTGDSMGWDCLEWYTDIFESLYRILSPDDQSGAAASVSAVPSPKPDNQAGSGAASASGAP